MGNKHTPNTCETSHPHGNPPHVDEININEKGKPDGHSSKHHTDPSWVRWGEQKKEADRRKK